MSDGQWTIAGADAGGTAEPYSPRALAAAAEKGPTTMSFAYERSETDDALLLGIPWSYTWIRVSAAGKELYSAGSEKGTTLAAAARFALLNLPEGRTGRIAVEARISVAAGAARPYAAIGSERALLESAAAKSIPRIAFSALNAILFAAFALAFALRRRAGRPSRTLTFGLLNLALAINYILETPLAGLYSQSYLPVSLLEDCAYFFILPLAFRFVSDTVGLRGRPYRAAQYALFGAAVLESGFTVASFSFLSGFLYRQTYAFADCLALAAMISLFARIAPRGLLRKGDERTIAVGLLAFMLCAAYELISALIPGIPDSEEIAYTQIAFFAMTASLAMTAVGRYDRLRWKLEEMPGRVEPRGPGNPPADGDAKERRRKKIAGDPAIGRRIAYLLDEERVWNDETLSLPQFAELVGAPPHEVTIFIGERYGMHFSALINGRRIEESKRLLAETDYTVLRIALESGFSSKTAFYRSFGEVVGTSPAQFRAEARSANH